MSYYVTLMSNDRRPVWVYEDEDDHIGHQEYARMPARVWIRDEDGNRYAGEASQGASGNCNKVLCSLGIPMPGEAPCKAKIFGSFLCLNEMPASMSIPILQEVVDQCGTTFSGNVWDATPGDVGMLTEPLLEWAKEHPDYVWSAED